MQLICNIYHFLTTTYALLEREGWWLKKDILCLPKKGDKINRKLWVTEVTYLGNSKTFRSNDLDNNWSCTLDTKPPVDGDKTSAGVSPATKSSGRAKRRRSKVSAPAPAAPAPAPTAKNVEATAPVPAAKNVEATAPAYVLCSKDHAEILGLIQDRKHEEVHKLATRAFEAVESIETPAGTFHDP